MYGSSQAPGAILGHSMGGKVALALLQQAAAHAAAQRRHQHHQHQQQHHRQHESHRQSHQPHGRQVVPAESMASVAIAAAAGPPGEWCSPPRQLWVLDSQPGVVTTEQDAGTGISRVLSTVHVSGWVGRRWVGEGAGARCGEGSRTDEGVQRRHVDERTGGKGRIRTTEGCSEVLRESEKGAQRVA
jgi:hypothetical protein